MDVTPPQTPQPKSPDAPTRPKNPASKDTSKKRKTPPKVSNADEEQGVSSTGPFDGFVLDGMESEQEVKVESEAPLDGSAVLDGGADEAV